MPPSDLFWADRDELDLLVRALEYAKYIADTSAWTVAMHPVRLTREGLVVLEIDGVRCPICGKVHMDLGRWRCDCGEAISDVCLLTCPACGIEWWMTECPHCGIWSASSLWRVIGRGPHHATWGKGRRRVSACATEDSDVLKNFTDRAKKVLAIANQEAQRLGHDHIDTGHVLLAMLKEGHGVGAQALKEAWCGPGGGPCAFREATPDEPEHRSHGQASPDRTP